MEFTKTKEEDDFLFEIDDDIYMYRMFFTISLAIMMILVLYFKTEYDLHDYLARIAVIYIAVESTRKIYSFFIKKEIKIQFYRNKIIKNNKKIGLNNNEISEIYKVPLLFFYDYADITRYGLYHKIIYSILLPIKMLVNILFSIYHMNFQIHKAIVLIGKDDNKVIILPTVLRNKQKQELLDNYLKEYLNIDIKKQKTIWFIPQKGK